MSSINDEVRQELINYARISKELYQPVGLSRQPGPNRWDEMTPADFGPEHDFILEYHTDSVVFDPVSEAALQWCYRFLPEDCPRFGARGFMIERKYIDGVVEGARNANLMSVEDFEAAINEANNLREQWPQ